MKSVPIVFAAWDGVDVPCLCRVPVSHLVSAVWMWKKEEEEEVWDLRWTWGANGRGGSSADDRGREHHGVRV